MISRRKTLALLGGGTILAAAAAGGAGTFLTTRTPEKALAPWRKAGNYNEPRKRALSFAILAPNPHNRQPWLVDLSKDGQISLFVDTQKLLPHTDPFNRQITIGLGCFLEVLRMAAAQDGYRAKVENFPAGFDAKKLDQRPVAIISLVKDQTVQKDPLFAHVLSRRSLKEPFDLQRKVSDKILHGLAGVAGKDGIELGTTNQPAMINKLRGLTHQAMAIEIETPHTYKESVDLFRIGKAEINANPDGIDFSGPMFEGLSVLGMFTRVTALDTKSSGYQQGIDAVMANIDTAMGYVWLTTPTNTRLDQLRAGRDWVRVNLAATAMGVGLHPISQALQEYGEMQQPFEQLPKVLGVEGKTVQMLGRLGYADKVSPSPRWPVDAKIIKA